MKIIDNFLYRDFKSIILKFNNRNFPALALGASFK